MVLYIRIINFIYNMLINDLKRYLEDYYPSTKTMYMYTHLAELLAIEFDGKEITDITHRELQSFLEKKYTNWNTFNSRAKRLSVIFNFLLQEDIITDNPCKKIRKKKIPPGEVHPKHIPKNISRDLMKKILFRMNEKDYKYFLITLLLIESGCRISEALSVKKKHLVNDSIFLENTKTKTPRVIFFSGKTATLLKQYASSNVGEWLFPSDESFLKPVPYHNFEWRFEQITKDMKHPLTDRKITIHMLRHTFASDRVNCVNPVELMQLLGHLDIQTTMGYIHRSQSSIRAAFEKTKSIYPSQNIFSQIQFPISA